MIHALAKCKWPLASLRVFSTLENPRKYSWYCSDPLAIDITLEELPDSIGQLSSLQELIIFPTLRSLPPSISQLAKLERLRLSCTSDLNIEDMAPLQTLTALKSLKFSFHQKEGHTANLIILPDIIFSFISLQELYLTVNGSYSIPDTIGNLKNLRTLCLDSVQMEELPISLGDLSCLNALQLVSCNSITALPKSCGNLIALEELSVKSCFSLQTLPSR